MTKRPLCGGLPSRPRSLASGPCQRRALHKGMHRDVHGKRFRWTTTGTAVEAPRADALLGVSALSAMLKPDPIAELSVVERRVIPLRLEHLSAIKHALGRTIADIEYMGWDEELGADFKGALEALS